MLAPPSLRGDRQFSRSRVIFANREQVTSLPFACLRAGHATQGRRCAPVHRVHHVRNFSVEDSLPQYLVTKTEQPAAALKQASLNALGQSPSDHGVIVYGHTPHHRGREVLDHRAGDNDLTLSRGEAVEPGSHQITDRFGNAGRASSPPKAVPVVPADRSAGDMATD